MSSGFGFGSGFSSNLIKGQLNKTAQNIGDNYERLSSGLRINKASDDAAGLALASRLSTDARVYSQGIRNINHGVSMMNMASQALADLRAVTTRQSELANQAANSTLTRAQRVALNTEANLLVDEFNRIVQVAEYNDTKLLDNTFGASSVQTAGTGSAASISFSLAGALAETLGNGTFQTGVTIAAGTQPTGVTTGDFDGDGDVDFATVNYGEQKINVMLNNGNGTFATRVSYGIGASLSPWGITAGDVNSDGAVDLVTANGDNGTVSVMIGNGNGTFKTGISYSTGSFPSTTHVVLADFNEDGYLDIAANNRNHSKVAVLLNNGNGTYATHVTYQAGGYTHDVASGDVNNDGHMDLITANWSSANVSVLLGNGNGTFQSQITVTMAAGVKLSVAVTDFNHDGYLDVAATDDTNDRVIILLGNGNGTFATGNSYSTGSYPWKLHTADLNGDGYQDLISADNSADRVSVLLGNGNGTFQARTSYATNGNAWEAQAADFNGDGALEIISANWLGQAVSIFSPNTTTRTTMGVLNLTTQVTAQEAVTTIDKVRLRVDREIGRVAAYSSRFESAMSLLRAQRENLDESANRIQSVDVASETADLIRNKVIQDSGVALFAQANNLMRSDIATLLSDD